MRKPRDHAHQHHAHRHPRDRPRPGGPDGPAEEPRGQRRARRAAAVRGGHERADRAATRPGAGRGDGGAAEARAIAERAEAEAEQARLAASQAEAEHEDRIRAADRLDPRVDHQAEDYAPQVPGTDDVGPTPPAEVNAEPSTETSHAAPAAEAPTETSAETSADEPASGGAPLLPRRTPGANEMPGKPMESEGGGGGWFTRKDSTDS